MCCGRRGAGAGAAACGVTGGAGLGAGAAGIVRGAEIEPVMSARSCASRSLIFAIWLREDLLAVSTLVLSVATSCESWAIDFCIAWRSATLATSTCAGGLPKPPLASVPITPPSAAASATEAASMALRLPRGPSVKADVRLGRRCDRRFAGERDRGIEPGFDHRLGCRGHRFGRGRRDRGRFDFRQFAFRFDRRAPFSIASAAIADAAASAGSVSLGVSLGVAAGSPLAFSGCSCSCSAMAGSSRLAVHQSLTVFGLPIGYRPARRSDGDRRPFSAARAFSDTAGRAPMCWITSAAARPPSRAAVL